VAVLHTLAAFQAQGAVVVEVVQLPLVRRETLAEQGQAAMEQHLL